QAAALLPISSLRRQPTPALFPYTTLFRSSCCSYHFMSQLLTFCPSSSQPGMAISPKGAKGTVRRSLFHVLTKSVTGILLLKRTYVGRDRTSIPQIAVSEKVLFRKSKHFDGFCGKAPCFLGSKCGTCAHTLLGERGLVQCA